MVEEGIHSTGLQHQNSRRDKEHSDSDGASHHYPHHWSTAQCSHLPLQLPTIASHLHPFLALPVVFLVLVVLGWDFKIEGQSPSSLDCQWQKADAILSSQCSAQHHIERKWYFRYLGPKSLGF